MGTVSAAILPWGGNLLINALTKDFDVSGEAFTFFDDSENYIGWYGKDEHKPA